MELNALQNYNGIHSKMPLSLFVCCCFSSHQCVYKIVYLLFCLGAWNISDIFAGNRVSIYHPSSKQSILFNMCLSPPTPFSIPNPIPTHYIHATKPRSARDLCHAIPHRHYIPNNSNLFLPPQIDIHIVLHD